MSAGLPEVHTSGGKAITGKVDMQCGDDTMGCTICYHQHITTPDCDLGKSPYGLEKDKHIIMR